MIIVHVANFVLSLAVKAFRKSTNIAKLSTRVKCLVFLTHSVVRYPQCHISISS